MKQRLVTTVIVLFLAVVLLSWIFHGRGIIRNDPQRNIHIPEILTMPLQVRAAYDGKRILFRYRWPVERPYIYHDMLKYQGGAWQRIGKSVPGPQPQGIYEDRLTMFVDDGSIPEFGRYGGYITIGDGMRFFTDEATREEVRAHPYLGNKKHKKDVRKYLPETRSVPGEWSSIVPEEQLEALRKAGYFLDLWHWRAHRSNPAGKSDDQYVAEYRYGDSGRGVYYTNWDKKENQPKRMFNREVTGQVALWWDDLLARQLGFDDVYYLTEQNSVPYDPDYTWKDGDVLPRRILRSGSGSHGDISVSGIARWKEGFWDVTLIRAMDTGHPQDDKIFIDRRLYSVAFSVHRDATGSRWHYVSLPVELGLGRNAELVAERFTGELPSWNRPWLNVTLFYPGQVSWPLLNSTRHAGAMQIREGVPVRHRHSERQLALYGVEMEFDAEIRRQWLFTLLAGLFLIVSLGLAVIPPSGRREED